MSNAIAQKLLEIAKNRKMRTAQMTIDADNADRIREFPILKGQCFPLQLRRVNWLTGHHALCDKES